MEDHRAVLETKRLRIRRFTPSDAKHLEAVFFDEYSQRFYPAINTPEAVARWVEWAMMLSRECGFGLCALELKAGGTVIGDAGLSYQLVENERILEVGWHIHPAYRAMGFATEAGIAFRDHAFNDLGADFLGSIVDPANVASIRVASRVHDEHRQFISRTGPRLLFWSRSSRQQNRVLAE